MEHYTDKQVRTFVVDLKSAIERMEYGCRSEKDMAEAAEKAKKLLLWVIYDWCVIHDEGDDFVTDFVSDIEFYSIVCNCIDEKNEAEAQSDQETLAIVKAKVYLLEIKELFLTAYMMRYGESPERVRTPMLTVEDIRKSLPEEKSPQKYDKRKTSSWIAENQRKVKALWNVFKEHIENIDFVSFIDILCEADFRPYYFKNKSITECFIHKVGMTMVDSIWKKQASTSIGKKPTQLQADKNKVSDKFWGDLEKAISTKEK